VAYLVYARVLPRGKGQWGFVRTEEDIESELKIVRRELKALTRQLNIPITFIEEALNLKVSDAKEKLKKYDALIIYGFSGSPLCDIASLKIPTIFFIKCYSGPFYGDTLFAPFWHSKIKRTSYGKYVKLIFDDYSELVKFLRAVNALKRLKRTKALCIGQPNETFGGQAARNIAEKKFDVKIDVVEWEVFREFLDRVDENYAKSIANEFLRQALEVREVTMDNVIKAARVYLALKEMIHDGGYNAITVNCLTSEAFETLEATPCLAFSKLNDEGIIAACEADIPALLTMIVLNGIEPNKPSFLADPVPHSSMNTLILAHCTAPTKLKGFNEIAEPYVATTHHESGLSATPQVMFTPGGTVTVAGFDHDLSSMIITKGVITRSTSYPICRSQVEIKIENGKELLEKYVGFHWIMIYGDYVDDLVNFCRLSGVKASVT